MKHTRLGLVASFLFAVSSALIWAQSSVVLCRSIVGDQLTLHDNGQCDASLEIQVGFVQLTQQPSYSLSAKINPDGSILGQQNVLSSSGKDLGPFITNVQVASDAYTFTLNPALSGRLACTPPVTQNLDGSPVRGTVSFTEIQQQLPTFLLTTRDSQCVNLTNGVKDYCINLGIAPTPPQPFEVNCKIFQ